MMKKLIVLLFYCFIVLSLPAAALAQPEAPTPTPSIYLPMILKGPDFEFQQAIDQGQAGGMNKQYFDLKTVEDIMQTVITATGGELVEDENCPPGEQCYHRQGGAVAMVSNLVGGLYSTQPASSVEYLADLGSRLGLAKPAYAQGFGWQAFSPVLGLWKLFRNIAYLFFVIIFVVIGFMIMFRAKINPQTVISIQNALPRIIVTLLLITFSYAIAGLVIDLGQLATRIIGNTLAGPNGFIAFKPPVESKLILEELLQSNIFALVNPLKDPTDLVNALDKAIMELNVLEPLAWLTVRFVFYTAAFFIMFKIFFALIGPYVGIILSIIFAPLQLLIGAFPGAGGAGSWLKNLIANVAVFPVTFMMLAIAAVLRSGDSLAQKCQVDPSTGIFNPGGYAPWCPRSTEIYTLWSPATIGNWGAAVGQLAGFGVLFMIPKVVQMVQAALQIQPKPWSAAVGEEIKAGFGRVPLVGNFLASKIS